jgi:hypothetical protein
MIVATKIAVFFDMTPCTFERHLRVLKVEVSQQITTGISTGVTLMHKLVNPWAAAYIPVPQPLAHCHLNV